MTRPTYQADQSGPSRIGHTLMLGRHGDGKTALLARLLASVASEGAERSRRKGDDDNDMADAEV